MILIIDDDDPVRTVIARMVNRFGFEALTAPAGLDGLDLLRAYRGQIRCVLLDLALPGMSGDAVFGHIRDIAPDTPIIILTGFHYQDTVRRFADRPPAAVMQKPFTLDTFRETLERVVG
jgi:DNA-binding NtrC family response regulator